VQLIMTGILGEYIGRIYEQVKARPLYVIAERINPAQQGANDLPEAARFPRVVSVPDPADADLRAKR
jgi:hypothetical protein